MTDCERFESTIASYVAGEPDPGAIEAVLAHARMCAECRGLLELHRELVDLGASAPEPHERDFGRLDRQPTGVAAPALRRPAAAAFLRPGAAVAASLLLFAAGLASGLALSGRSGGSGDERVATRLVRALNADAASNRELKDVEDSRFTYSNVSVRRVDRERVDLEFDVTTHVRVEEPVRSELVRDVLVQTLLHPSSTGAKLKAMSLAAGSLEPKVKAALVFAMRNDESLAVRLEALSILAGGVADADVEVAILAALRDDGSVPMRLMALEALAAHRVDPDRLRGAIGESERPGREALLVRLADYGRSL